LFLMDFAEYSDDGRRGRVPPFLGSKPSHEPLRLTTETRNRIGQVLAAATAAAAAAESNPSERKFWVAEKSPSERGPRRARAAFLAVGRPAHPKRRAPRLPSDRPPTALATALATA
jgi:hypothetical protein